MAKVDLTGGYARQHIDHTQNTLNDTFEALAKLMDVKLAKDEKLLLNSIESLTNKSAKFNSEEDFQEAYSVLEQLQSSITFPNAVTNSFLDIYTGTLDSNHEVFTADSTLKNMYYDVSDQLRGLKNQEQSSQLPALLSSVEQLTREYRDSANKSVVSQAEKLHQDILDAIWVADNLNRIDIENGGADDPRWNIGITNEYYSASADLYRAGDFKGAKRELVKGGKYGIRKFWEDAGAGHRGSLDTFMYTQNLAKKEIRDMDMGYKDAGGSKITSTDRKNIKEKSIFRHRGYVPKFGKHKMTQDNLHAESNNWTDFLRTIINDDGRYIKFGEEDSPGRKIKDAFYPDLASGGILAGPEGVKAAIIKEMIKADEETYGKDSPDRRYPTVDYIGRDDMIDYLAANIHFTPDHDSEFGALLEWPGWNETWDGINRLGAEFFLDVINTGAYLNNIISSKPDPTTAYGGVDFILD
jgi:hypothetical protein